METKKGPQVVLRTFKLVNLSRLEKVYLGGCLSFCRYIVNTNAGGSVDVLEF